MGAGRKTSTYDVDTSAASVASFEEAKRNLGETGKLGGVIFGCSKETIRECLDGLIFGLPRSHFSYVYWIEPGLPVFLFNYNDRNMHGVFKATTYGQLEINPNAWTGSTTLKTRFPAQVEVEVWKDCLPVNERDFKPIMKNCYYQNSDKNNCYFVFELTKGEAKRLIAKFEERPRPAQPPASKPQQPVSGQARASLPPVTASPPPADGWQVVTKKKGPKSPTAGSGPLAWSQVVRPSSPATTTSFGSEVPSRAATNFATENEGSREEAELQHAIEASRAEVSANPASLLSREPRPSAAQLFEANQLEVQHAFTSKGPGSLPLSSSSRPPSSNSISNMSSLPLALRAPGPSPPSCQALQGLVTRSNPEERLQLELTQQQREDRIRALCTDRQRFLRLASETSGTESLEHSMKAVQIENEELRQQQAILASEIKTLQRQMLAMQPLTAGKSSAPAIRQAVHAARVGSIGNASEASTSRPDGHEMFMVGGNTGEAWLTDVDIFTPPGSWRQGTPMPEARGYGALASIPGSILYLGGGNGSSWMSSVIRYDLNTCKWLDAPDMSTARGSLAAAVLDGKVYAIGGGQPAVSLETIEIWDLNLNSFMSGKSMMQKRFTTAAAALGGCVYACGGYNNSRYLDSMERLDPREGHWCNAASLQQRRGAHSVTVIDEQIVAIGGWDGKRALDVVEAYDPRADQWRLLEPLTVPRSYCAATTISGRVVVAGGIDGPNHVESMQRLDMKSGTWVNIAVPAGVPTKRSFLAACVVPQRT